MDSNRFFRPKIRPGVWRYLLVIALAGFCFGSPLNALQDKSAEPDELYALAASFYTDQNWDEAVKSFRQLLAEHADSEFSANARFYLGESLVQTESHHEAAKVFQEFVDSHPDNIYNTRASFRLAECRYLTNQFKPAQQAFESFLEAHPDDPLAEFALPYLGELHLRFSDPERAKQRYQEALKRFPTSGLSNKCRLGLAQSLAQLSEYDEAERFFRFVGKQKNDELADDALLLLAKMYTSQSDWERAGVELAELVREFPDSNSHAEARYLKAKQSMVSGQWQRCWLEIEPLLKESLESGLQTRVALDAAVVAVRIDNLQKAKEIIDGVSEDSLSQRELEFKRVVEIDVANRRKDFKQLQKLVLAFEQQFSDSIHLTRCIEPLARMLYDRGDFAPAAAKYQQLLELVSLRPHLAGNRPAWLYLLGLSRIGTGEFESALRQLETINNFSNNVRFEAATSFAIATALAGDKQWAKAIPEYQKYLEMLPEGEDAIRCQADLAVAYARTDQLDEALASVRNVISHDDDQTVLAAVELIAEKSLAEDKKSIAREMFEILARSADTKFAARGASGLVWAEDETEVDQSTVKNLVNSGVDSKVALEAVIGKVQKLQTRGKHEQVVSLLHEVIQQYDDAPLLDEARFRMAVSLQRIGGEENSTQAADLLTEFVEKHPKHELSDLARYELAWAWHDVSNFEAAEQQFSEIVDEFPQSEYRIDACYRSAVLLKQREDPQQSMLRLRQLIGWDPEHYLAEYAWYSLGEFESNAENWPEAIRCFNKVVEQSTEVTLVNPARYWLAESYYQSGQQIKAEDEFAQLKDITFDRPEINAVVFLRLAQCAAKRSDWETVEQVIENCRNNHSEHTPSYQLDYLQGRVHMSRAKFREARTSLENVLSDDQGKGTQTAAMSQWMIGETYFHQEDYQNALRAYLLVESLYDFPKWRALSLLQAAKCHLHLDDTGQASRTCQRMLDTFPESTHADDARSLLAEIQKSTPLKPKVTPANFSKQK